MQCMKTLPLLTSTQASLIPLRIISMSSDDDVGTTMRRKQENNNNMMMINTVTIYVNPKYENVSLRLTTTTCSDCVYSVCVCVSTVSLFFKLFLKPSK